MSFGPLLQSLEQDVNRFAEQLHIGHDEAVLMLIKTGLSIMKPGTFRTSVPTTLESKPDPAHNEKSNLIDQIRSKSREEAGRGYRAPKKSPIQRRLLALPERGWFS